MATSFNGEGSRSTRGESPTMGKQLVNNRNHSIKSHIMMLNMHQILHRGIEIQLNPSNFGLNIIPIYLTSIINFNYGVPGPVTCLCIDSIFTWIVTRPCNLIFKEVELCKIMFSVYLKVWWMYPQNTNSLGIVLNRYIHMSSVIISYRHNHQHLYIEALWRKFIYYQCINMSQGLVTIHVNILSMHKHVTGPCHYPRKYTINA
jgi:hypothetical protein